MEVYWLLSMEFKSGTLQPLLIDMIERYGDEFDEIFNFINPKTGKKASVVLREKMNGTVQQQKLIGPIV